MDFEKKKFLSFLFALCSFFLFFFSLMGLNKCLLESFA